MAYLVDQQTVMFYKRLQSSENIVLRVLGRLKHDAIVACFSKYGIRSLRSSVFDSKQTIWLNFVKKCSDVNRLYFIFSFSVFYRLCDVFNMWLLRRNKR